jgi:hypothetical protein
MVEAALGNPAAGACDAGDRDGDGDITVDEVVFAVPNAMRGCPT